MAKKKTPPSSGRVADLMPPMPAPRHVRAPDTPSMGIPTSDIPAEQRRLEADLVYGRPGAFERLREFERSVRDIKIPKPAKDVRLPAPKLKIKDRPTNLGKPTA